MPPETIDDIPDQGFEHVDWRKSVKNETNPMMVAPPQTRRSRGLIRKPLR